MLLALGTFVALASEPTVEFGYHGDLITHPGVLARGSMAVTRPVSLEAQAMAYWHPGLMTVAQLRAGPAFGWVGPRGASWGAFVHGGVSRGFWTAPTYQVAGGRVSRLALAGDAWAVLAAGVALGHAVESGPLAAWTVRPQVGLRVPTFHGAGIDVGVDLTVRLRGAR